MAQTFDHFVFFFHRISAAVAAVLDAKDKLQNANIFASGVYNYQILQHKHLWGTIAGVPLLNKHFYPPLTTLKGDIETVSVCLSVHPSVHHK